MNVKLISVTKPMFHPMMEDFSREDSIMTTRKKYKLVGMIIALTGLGLCIYNFGWKFTLILIIILWGNNLEQQNKEL